MSKGRYNETFAGEDGDLYAISNSHWMTLRPSANKDSYCWGQDIPNNNFKSIEYIRLSSCIFKMIGPEENMLKISWQSGVPSRSYQQ